MKISKIVKKILYKKNDNNLNLNNNLNKNIYVYMLNEIIKNLFIINFNIDSIL